MPRALSSVAFVLALSLSAGAVHAQVDPSPDAVRAGTYNIDPAHSKITWSVNHMGFSTYIGQFAHADGVLKLDPKAVAASTLDVTVDVNSLGTLNTALDGHLKTPAFLDVAKFPTATFHATHVARTGERTADITGDLTLHGVTKPVTIQATFNLGGISMVTKSYKLGFAGSAKIKRSDFGITAFLPAIGDEVTLTIEAEFSAVPAA